MNKREENGIIKWLPSICVILVGVALILLFYHIRLLGDDYDYFSYFRHGFSTFIFYLKEHYQNLNGRLLVHFILCILLSFNSFVPTVLFDMICSAVLIYFSAKNIGIKDKKTGIYLFALLGALFLLIGDYVIVDAELWISGFLNYVFPTTLLIMYLYFVRNLSTTKNKILAVILALLSALTTELIGVLTVIVSLFVFIMKWWKKENMRMNAGCTVLSVIGLAFLLSSPGIQNRFMNNSDMGIIQRALVNFTTFSHMMFQTKSLLILFCISAICLACSSFKMAKNQKLSLALLVFAVIFGLNIVLEVFDTYLYMLIYIVYSLSILWYCIVWLKEKESAPLLYFMCFTAAMGINCVSGVIAFRMLYVPGVFLVLLIAHAFYSAELPQKYMTAALTFLCILALLKTFYINRINAKNAQIWDENQAKILHYDHSGSITFQYMYDTGYFPNAFEYFMGSYMQEFGITDAVQVSSHAENTYQALDQNNHIVSHHVVQMKDTYYMPVREVADYIGATITWTDPIATVSTGEKSYRFKSYTKGVMTAPIGGKAIKLHHEIIIINSTLYLSLTDANMLFHINLKVE